MFMFNTLLKMLGTQHDALKSGTLQRNDWPRARLSNIRPAGGSNLVHADEFAKTFTGIV